MRTKEDIREYNRQYYSKTRRFKMKNLPIPEPEELEKNVIKILVYDNSNNLIKEIKRYR